VSRHDVRIRMRHTLWLARAGGCRRSLTRWVGRPRRSVSALGVRVPAAVWMSRFRWTQSDEPRQLVIFIRGVDTREMPGLTRTVGVWTR
jgi:hypothetical protein